MTRIVGDALREHLPEALIHQSEVELLVSTTTVPGLLRQLVWKDGKAVKASGFEFRNTSKASKVELEDLKGTADLPEHFTKGASK